MKGTMVDGVSVAAFIVIPSNDPPFNNSKPYGFVRVFFGDGLNWKATTASVLSNPMLQQCPVSAQCNDRWVKRVFPFFHF
jgi:hypothetical protein